MTKLQLLEKMIKTNDFPSFVSLKVALEDEYAVELASKTDTGNIGKVTRHAIKLIDKQGKNDARFGHYFIDDRGRQVFTDSHYLLAMERELQLPTRITIGSNPNIESVSKLLSTVAATIACNEKYTIITSKAVRYYKTQGHTHLWIDGKLYSITELERVLGYSMAGEIRLYSGDTKSAINTSAVINESNYFEGLLCPCRQDKTGQECAKYDSNVLNVTRNEVEVEQ